MGSKKAIKLEKSDQFFLEERHSGGGRLETTESIYSKIVYARDCLVSLRSVEDIFAVSVAAFGDFEKKLLTIALDYYHDRARSHDDWRGYFDSIREEMNLAVLTVLTTGKAFNDQTLRHAARLERAIPGLCQTMEAEFSKQFDEYFEYRIAVALRNTAQHSELPISSYSLTSTNLSEENDDHSGSSRLRQTVNPVISVKNLATNKKVSSKIRKELGGLQSEGIDLKFMLRGYIACLARVIAKFRQETSQLLEKNLLRLEAAGRLFSQKTGRPESRFLSLASYSGDQVKDTFAISTDIFGTLRKKRRRWTSLQYVQRGYVSSEAILRQGIWPDEHSEILIEK